MCVLFVYIDNDAPSGCYQVIIANNRDEYYDRPTKAAEKWGEENAYISGRDMMHGKEGGTWLALSSKGKFASLLNILQNGTVDPSKKGRGFLVLDFLRSNLNGEQYSNGIADQRDQYNGFNLVMVERSNKKWELSYFSNLDPESPYKVVSGVSGYGNSTHKKPWIKVQSGTEQFENITKELNNVGQKDKLQEALLDFLNDCESHLPDPVLESQQNNRSKYVKERSCLQVNIPAINYGTRTNTIILLDSEGQGEYMERTLREPIDRTRPAWDTTIIPLVLEQQSE